MNQPQQIVGITTIALVVTGVFGLIAAFLCFFGAQWVGAGLCLIGAALAFGLLLNALLK